jgi:hypothetical protein
VESKVRKVFLNSSVVTSEMSRPMDEEDFDDLPDDVKEQLMRFDSDEDLEEEFKRKLQ